MTSPSRFSTAGGYHYDPTTGGYTTTQQSSSHSRPPPLPPKELEAGYVTKETQLGYAELEGDLDIGFDEKPASRVVTPHKSKRPAPRPKRKLRVLSLDGGGIRGYSTLVILGELMHQIFLLNNAGKGPASPSDLPRPCDYFDLIGGTGTGGLIALMLGRMRMDIESCKEYYVELTRYVFITDKTVMGVPYGKTLFKASRLEEAIRHCVSESTRSEHDQIVPHSPPPKPDDRKRIEPRRSGSWRNSMGGGRASSVGHEESRGRRGQRRGGNPDAPLLDPRKGACKTFVTAVYKGTPPNASASPALLRTYPSRAESAPSYNCTIWQAGRATSATLAAFKPITVGQNTFLDEGSGRYNPAQQVLEEAHINEYPDDDIGVFISVGTGKRPDNTPSSPGRSSPHHGHGHGHGHIHGHGHSHSTGDRPMWWEGIIATPFEDFTEARRKLMAKLDDCERVHRALIDPEDGGRPGLAKMGVAREDYYRFNVEVGVGEFALNEWNRLPEVSTNTRRYISQRETSKLLRECATKMVAIEQQNKAPAPAPTPTPTPAPVQPPRRMSSPGVVRPSPPRAPDCVAELSAEIQAAAIDWSRSAEPPREMHPSQRPYSVIGIANSQQRPFSPVGSPPGTHPSQRPFSPVEQMVVEYPPEPPHLEMPEVPPKPPKPLKESRPLYPDHAYGDNPYYAAGPNPEIRLTSPTTVAGDSDDEGRKIGSGRRHRSRSRSGSHSGSGKRR